MKNDKSKFVTISTKLSVNSVSHLKLIFARMGNTIYDMGQAVFAFFLHTFDSPHSCNEREEVMLSEFNEIAKNSLRVTDPTSDTVVKEATYYIMDKKKSGVYGALVKRPMMEGNTPQVSYNHREIMERAWCLLYPDEYKRLRIIGAELHTSNIIETIILLRIRESDRQEIDSINEGFADNERNDYGKVCIPSFGNKAKRKHHIDMESMQNVIDFDALGTVQENNEL